MTRRASNASATKLEYVKTPLIKLADKLRRLSRYWCSLHATDSRGRKVFINEDCDFIAAGHASDTKVN